MTGAEYMGRVAALPCSICRTSPVEVHHRRAGTGGGRRASDFDTIPLCYEHHRGASGVHGLGTKAFARTYDTTEATLVDATQTRLGVSAGEVEVWKQALRDRRRKVPKPARGPKTPSPSGNGARWPSRKLTSRSGFRTGALGQGGREK